MRGLNKHFRHNSARLFAAVLVTIMVFNFLPFAAPDGAVAYAMELSGSYSLNGTDYSGTLSDAFDALTAEGTNTLVLKSDFLVDNKSMNCGGGICLKTGGCTLNNITLTGNSASDKGGGICDLGYGVKPVRYM